MAKTSTSATTPDRATVTPPGPPQGPSVPPAPPTAPGQAPGASLGPPPPGVADKVKDRARLDQAADTAKTLAAALKRHKRAVDRKLVAAFQKLAGLTADGVYGPKTAGALQWYTGEAIPPLTGKGFTPYAPTF